MATSLRLVLDVSALPPPLDVWGAFSYHHMQLYAQALGPMRGRSARFQLGVSLPSGGFNTLDAAIPLPEDANEN